jgi:hypothetical protein
MQSLFDRVTRTEIETRIARLQPNAVRQWGTMEVAQMLAHCAMALEMGTGDMPSKQSFIGKLMAPFFKTTLLGPKPFSHNSPTNPLLRVQDAHDFGVEKARLLAVVGRFATGGQNQAAQQEHSFLGKISGDQWGFLMWKHLDHHLQQFSA